MSLVDGLCKGMLMLGNINPLDIAVNAENGQTTIHVEGEQSFVEMFQLANLYYMLKRDGLIWGAIVIVCLLMSMLFIRRSEKLAERKADILHKIIIVFLICSVLWILGVVVALFDDMF